MSNAMAGAVKLALYANTTALRNTRIKIAELEKRIENAGSTASRDPVLVLEIIRAANIMAVSEGKAPLTTVNTSLVRLGSKSAAELLDSLSERQSLGDDASEEAFEKVRKDCAHIGTLAGLVSEVLARNLREDAQTIGTLLMIGELVAISHLKDIYLEAAALSARSKMLYRLEKDHRCNFEDLTVSYLTKWGMPEPILSVIDRNAQPRMPARQILKPICSNACELYYAALEGKLEKFAPDQTLPLKSTMRVMQLKDAQHKAIYEKVSEYCSSNL